MRKKMFIIFAIMAIFAGASFAGSYEVIYDSGDVQKAAYTGNLAITVNYTDGTITDPATKIDLLASHRESNMNDGSEQDLGLGATFSVDVYGDSSNTDIRFNFYVYPYDGGRFYLDVAIDFTGWQNITVNLADMSWYTMGSMTQEEGLEGSVGIFQLGGPYGATPGTIYIDNAKLTIEILSYSDVNLIQNGDAESEIDLQSWFYGATPPPVLPLTISDFVYEDHSDTDVSDPGTDSFVLDNTDDIFTGCEIRSLAIPTDPNEPYLLKFWYKTMPGFNLLDPAGLRADFRTWENGYARYIGGTNFELPVTDGAWVQVVEEVVTPGDPSVEVLDFVVSLQIHGFADGVVLIDEIELYDTNCDLVAVDDLFADTNNGFESGDTTSWHTTTFVTVVDTEASEGTYSLQCDTGGVSQIVHNAASTSGVEDVIYSFDVKTAVGAAAPPASYAQVRFYDSDAGAYVDWTTIPIPLTEGQWTTVSGKYPVHPDADLVDVFLRWDGAELAYFDNVSVWSAEPDCDWKPGPDELRVMASQWLNNDFQALLPDVGMDDFEGYANQAALDLVWTETSGTYPSTGSQTITLITDPGQTHSGSKAVRWDYDNSGSVLVITEFNTVLGAGIDLTQYNEMHVWMNRHAGNSLEDIFYIKFYNGTIAQGSIKAESWIDDPDGSTQSPTGWTKWIIDLDNLTRGTKADLDNVVGYFFGAVGQAGIGYGSGTIDFDDIVLVNSIPNCGSSKPVMDLNDDCIVSLGDFAVLAKFWVGN